MKAFLKILAGQCLFRVGAYRYFSKGRAVIALFHRIDDNSPDDSLCCSQRDFDKFCRFFRKYYTVIPLSDLLEKLERREDVSGLLSITFDDGYLDNATLAAPILKKYGLPACFFVTPGFLNTGCDAPWDAERGVRSEWMSWEQVRELADQGFEIGAHTMTHVDLGQVEGAAARWEIDESRRQLEGVLQKPVDLFAYPFGGANQCSRSNRNHIRNAQFRCCLSAYGGVVHNAADPFQLERTSITPQWFRSPYQFGLEMMLKKIPAQSASIGEPDMAPVETTR